MPSLQLLNCWTCLIIKRWKYNPHERRCSSGWSVCVCVCLRARVCACAARSKTDRRSTLWASDASKRSNTHKACKNGRLGEYSLKHSLYLKVNENSWENIVCQYFVLVTDWCFINVNQRTNAKRKSLTALNLYKVVALISINLSIYTVKTMQCSFIFDHFQIYFVTYLNINVSRLSWKNLITVFFFFICFMVWQMVYLSVCLPLFLCSCSYCILCI